jgi:N-methylhydantoinase A
MQSDGGPISAARAQSEPARVLFSGPAGGVVATRLLANQLGLGAVLAFDMGGTSTDVSFVGNQASSTRTSHVDGIPVALPAIDVHSVGCGGGSLAYVDRGGALRVGPQSAGADPGPACYGRSDRPTVTDAHVALGRIGPGRFLGGEFLIDPDRSVHAIENLARELALSPRRTAEGILRVADSAMERALKVMSLQRGEDPRRLTLVAFGGAGGLHGIRLARALGIPRIVVPPLVGALSALGLALAEPSVECSASVFELLDDWRPAARQRMVRELTREACGLLDRDALSSGTPVVVSEVDLRYQAQSFELRCPLTSDLAQVFARAHERTFGFARPGAPIEVVQLRVRARSAPQTLVQLEGLATQVEVVAAVAQPPLRSAFSKARIPRWHRAELTVGERLAGPGLIEEYSGSVALEAGSHAEVAANGCLVLSP